MKAVASRLDFPLPRIISPTFPASNDSAVAPSAQPGEGLAQSYNSMAGVDARRVSMSAFAPRKATFGRSLCRQFVALLSFAPRKVH